MLTLNKQNRRKYCAKWNTKILLSNTVSIISFLFKSGNGRGGVGVRRIHKPNVIIFFAWNWMHNGESCAKFSCSHCLRFSVKTTDKTKKGNENKYKFDKSWIFSYSPCWNSCALCASFIVYFHSVHHALMCWH